MDNSEIAIIFRDIADLLERKKENVFKIRAYRKAAGSIEELTVDIGRLMSEDRLKEIPGAGEAITKKITELATTGKLDYYERLKAEFTESIHSARGQGNG
ncbi:hypothetical protein ACFLVB_02730 [Chloroflexota bacterium]